MSHNVVVFIGVIAYVILLFVIVFIVRGRASKDAVSFAIANRSISPFLLCTMIVGAGIASTAVLGCSDQGATVGLPGIWFTWSGGFGNFLASFLTVAWYRKQNIVTVPEAFKNTWDDKTRMVSLIPFAIQGYIGYLCQVPLCSTVLAPLLGITPQVCYIILPIVFIGLYVIAGVWGIAITGIINFVMLFIGIMVGLVTSVDFAGSLSSISSLPSNYFNPFSTGVAAVISAFVGSVFFGIYSCGSICAGAKDVPAAKKGLRYGGLLTMLFGLGPVLIGMYTKVGNPDIKGGVMAFLGSNSSATIHMILIMGVIAAIVSTVPLTLNMPASVLVLDVIKGYIRPDISPKQQLLYMRIIGIVLGLVAIPMAPVLASAGIIPVMMQSTQCAIFAGFILLMHIYIRPVSCNAAFISILIPCVVAIFWLIFPIWGLTPMYPAIVVGIPTMLISMKIYPAPPRQKKVEAAV